MEKRTWRAITKAILSALSDGKEHSYGDLERKANTNWQSIRNHCSDLVLFNVLTISDGGVRITKEGRDLLKKF